MFRLPTIKPTGKVFVSVNKGPVTTSHVLDAARLWHRCPNEQTAALLKLRIVEWLAPFPDNLCSWCGKSDTENEQDGFGRLVPVTVSIAEGEEGSACVKQWVCNDHLIHLEEEFQRLRFVDHRHGGANFLEDVDCPGFEDMKACPCPSEYGEFVVLPRGSDG